jgi:methylmalonyl-CoA/ethylmalonyl-CoA epimerase
MIERLHQVAQRADDLPRATAFYRDVLELELVAQFDPPGLVFFDIGNTRLLLEKSARSSILYLEVDEIDAAVQTLRERDVEIVQEPHLIHRDEAGQFGPVGTEEWMAFFEDSEGNILGLVERRSP